MNQLSFNSDFSCNSFSDRDVLSVFKQDSEKNLTIQKGMSVKEISEIVSDKVMEVIMQQFETTKEKFQSKNQ